MPGEPQQKRRRLPFKPPSRTSSAGPSAESSATAKDKGKAKETTSKTSKPASASASTSKSQSSTKASSSKRPHSEVLAALPATPSEFDSDSDSEGGDAERAVSEEPDYILAEITHRTPEENIAIGTPQINPKLLTGIFHHFFKNEKTRISKDADALMAKYMDLFVREAIARGKLERDLVNESKGRSGPADNFIEVEDLETLSPYLVMDF